jgi:hypothetical protein
VNLRVGVEGAGWGAYVFANNASDAAGATSAGSGLGYTRLVYSIPPRTFGVNFRKSLF